MDPTKSRGRARGRARTVDQGGQQPRPGASGEGGQGGPRPGAPRQQQPSGPRPQPVVSNAFNKLLEPFQFSMSRESKIV